MTCRFVQSLFEVWRDGCFWVLWVLSQYECLCVLFEGGGVSLAWSGLATVPLSGPCWLCVSGALAHSYRCQPHPHAQPCPTWCQWQWSSPYGQHQHCMPEWGSVCQETISHSRTNESYRTQGTCMWNCEERNTVIDFCSYLLTKCLCETTQLQNGCIIIFWPAVDHHWAGISWALGFDSADEAQQACSVVRYSMVRPASEMELPDLPDLMSSSLQWTNKQTHTRTHQESLRVRSVGTLFHSNSH